MPTPQNFHPSTPHPSVLIIGGGAAGMTAAIQASQSGAQVTVIEHKDRIGKKILSTGNGKCNFTNARMEAACYRSLDPAFPMEVINRFGVRETLDFFRSLGIYPRERSGYYYPASNQASSVLDVLRLALAEHNVNVICEEAPAHIEKTSKGSFRIRTAAHSYTADALILATGGRAAPKTGSDGSGYVLAKAFGHRIIRPLPALVQLKCAEPYFKQLAGIRTEANVELLADNSPVASDQGELQLTAYGISGIPVFQVSRYASEYLERGAKVTARLDLLPGISSGDLRSYLEAHTPDRYIGLCNKNLMQLLWKLSGGSKEEFARLLKDFRVRVTGTNGFDSAQVTAGGVDVREIDPATMMSRLVDGLYFAGELMDVDGICGGYNLQWAWSSGAIAGRSAASVICSRPQTEKTRANENKKPTFKSKSNETEQTCYRYSS